MARQIAWIPTPYAVYTAAYDAGGRLWFGGGFWYGSGFLGCADQDGAVRWYDGGDGWLNEPRPRDWRNSPTWGPVTVSGLWLTGDGHHIVLSMWSASVRPHPTRVFALDAQGPRPAYDRPVAHDAAEASTGVIVHAGHLWLRQRGREPNRALVGAPSKRLDHPGGPSPVLSSRRLVGLGDSAVTGWSRSLLVRAGDSAPKAASKVPDVGRHKEWAIGARESRRGHDYVGERSTVVLGIRNDVRSDNASAITANEAGTHIFGGFSDGALATWSARECGDLSELVLEDVRPAHRFPIAAACHLPSGDLVTADRGGWVHHWRDGVLTAEWCVDTLHSPRTLAADPISGRLAVGCKHGDGGPSQGGIAIVQL